MSINILCRRVEKRRGRKRRRTNINERAASSRRGSLRPQFVKIIKQKYIYCHFEYFFLGTCNIARIRCETGLAKTNPARKKHHRSYDDRHNRVSQPDRRMIDVTAVESATPTPMNRLTIDSQPISIDRCNRLIAQSTIDYQRGHID